MLELCLVNNNRSSISEANSNASLMGRAELIAKVLVSQSLLLLHCSIDTYECTKQSTLQQFIEPFTTNRSAKKQLVVPGGEPRLVGQFNEAKTFHKSQNELQVQLCQSYADQ